MASRMVNPFLLFSPSVVSNSLRPHGLRHSRLPCPTPSPGSCSNYVHRVSDAIQPSRPLFVVPFSSCLLFFPASGSFPALHIRWPKYYWRFSFSISPCNEYSGLISLGLTVLISLQSKGFSRVFSNTTIRKHQFFSAQPSLWSNSYIHTQLLEKPQL